MVLGFVLTGGGARGAYQAGVLKAVAETLDELNVPVRIFTGLSAGAINATFCASGADNLLRTTERLCDLWSNLESEQIYRSDFVSLSRIGLGWLADVSFGSMFNRKWAHSLLDHSPLRELLSSTIDFSGIGRCIENGSLEALACSAFDYDTNMTITFLQGSRNIQDWTRPRRRSQKIEFTVDHIMASSSIPVLFPPTFLGDRYFGDGSLRNMAPISPAIHLGCDKLIIVGVRYPMTQESISPGKSPTVGRILGLMLNSLFFDSTDVDVERLRQLNEMLKHLPESYHASLMQRPIDYTWICPSVDLGALAGELTGQFPKAIRYLLGGLGNRKESSELASYLLFEADFTRRLVEIGYQDGKSQKAALKSFIQTPAPLAQSVGMT